MAQSNDNALLRPSAKSISGWTTEHKATPDIGDVGIFVKSKTTTISTTLPKELYLTHIYRLTVRCTGKLAAKNNLIVHVYLLNSLTKDEITKDGKPAIEINSGSSAVDLTHGEASLKVKFIDTSYHHGKTDFCLRVSVSERAEDEPTLLVSKLSVPFKVYSKKRSATPQHSRKPTANASTRSPSPSSTLMLRYMDDPLALTPTERDTVREMFVAKTPTSDLSHLHHCIQQRGTPHFLHSRGSLSSPHQPHFQHHQFYEHQHPNRQLTPQQEQQKQQQYMDHSQTSFAHQTRAPFQTSTLASLTQYHTHSSPPTASTSSLSPTNHEPRPHKIESLLDNSSDNISNNNSNKETFLASFPQQHVSHHETHEERFNHQFRGTGASSHATSRRFPEHQGFNLPPLRFLQQPQSQPSPFTQTQTVQQSPK